MLCKSRLSLAWLTPSRAGLRGKSLLGTILIDRRAPSRKVGS
jgi:hypothetical protein